MRDKKPPIDDLYLMHYGMPRRSGRYPWGSGEDSYQHSGDFLSRVYELREQNFQYTDDKGKKYTGDTAIAKSMGLTSTQFRTQLSLAKDERRALLTETAERLRYKEGLTLTEVAEKMGFKNDSSVRSLLNQSSKIRMEQAKNTAEILKKEIEEKGMLDVGKGVEYELGVSREKMEQALYMLKTEGYEVYNGRIPQPTNPGQLTTVKVLCKPGAEHKDIYNFGDIKSVGNYISPDGGDTFKPSFQYPRSMDSKRLMIRYKEDGGIDKDGLVEIRRGLDDLSLGNSHYSQVRILVDDKKYIKGMAIYGRDEDFPDGVDVIFNTNKGKNVSKLDVLKDVKEDSDNPFGSAIKEKGGQYTYIDKNGKEQLGLINKRADEGDWSDWSNKVSAQFLSKQSLSLANRQLKIAGDDKQKEFEDICNLTNPTIKKRLLESFADDCDSSAVHLRAAALPRQKYHVIIPIPSLKDNEIYAPNYDNGETLALVRYPHGGTFEIPLLKVNNNHKTSKQVLGPNVIDAVGINSKVAERLSGADFDGDTVMVIPTGKGIKITSERQLKGLEGFDPKMTYGTEKRSDGYYNAQGKKVKIMGNTQIEMGKISNLITDMTILGATPEEKARAVRHSMVVIDAEKHKLDYKKSFVDNGIASLKKKYQGSYDENGKYTEGAATIISRAKSQASVPKRQGTPHINIKGKPDYDPSLPEGALLYKISDDVYKPYTSKSSKTGKVTLRSVTGERIIYDPTDAKSREEYAPVKVKDKDTGAVKFTNKKGTIEYEMVMKTQKSTKMAETNDAGTLMSKAQTPMEHLYANYANRMKDLANRARVELVNTGKIEYSSNAKKIYQEEVDELNRKLQISLKNAPRERQALAIANSVMKAKKQDNPDMDREEEKKLSQQALTSAREKVGAKRTSIEISDREWEAIQAGAISENKLKQILDNADIDTIRQKATPRETKTLSQSKINRINSMRSSGLTIQQIASALGVSTSTVSSYLR